VADARVNSREVVDQIWSNVATEQVLELTSGLGSAPEFDQLVLDEERRYLNAHVVLTNEPASLAGGGRLPTVKGKAKERAGRFIVNVLGRYFADEHEFNAHLVRLLNKITVHHDEMGAEIRALHDAVRADSDRLRQANAVLHQRLEARLEALEDEVRTLRAALAEGRA
jgi:hypothetical protein